MWKTYQATLKPSRYLSGADYASYKGTNLHYVFSSLNIFKDRNGDVASAIGVGVLASVSKAAVSLNVVAPYISELVHEGLIYLGTHAELWQAVECPEDISQFRNWIAEGPDHIRRYRLQTLFGIQERRANRFLLLSGEKAVSTTNDIGKAYESADAPRRLVFDALAFANQLRASTQCPLFTIVRENVA